MFVTCYKLQSITENSAGDFCLSSILQLEMEYSITTTPHTFWHCKKIQQEKKTPQIYRSSCLRFCSLRCIRFISLPEHCPPRPGTILLLFHVVCYMSESNGCIMRSTVIKLDLQLSKELHIAGNGYIAFLNHRTNSREQLRFLLFNFKP